MRRPSVFEDCCLCLVGRMWYENFLNNPNVRPKILCSGVQNLEGTLNLN